MMRAIIHAAVIVVFAVIVVIVVIVNVGFVKVKHIRRLFSVEVSVVIRYSSSRTSGKCTLDPT